MRKRVLEGVADVLERGQALTFSNLSEAAGVPERTLYRHFPSKEALLAAVFEWANQRVGFSGDLPGDAEDLRALVRQVFPGFDGVAPLVRELLAAPEGRNVRLADKAGRQRAALALARHELHGLDRATIRRVAAILQLLSVAATWQTLREYWDMDGAEAAETCALAVDLVLEGARARRPGKRPPRKKRATRARSKETLP